MFDEGNGPLTCPSYNPDTGTDTAPGSLLPSADRYAAANFNDKVVLIAITNYGMRGVQDARFQSHYSLLKTIEAAFGLPYLGHANDATTNTLAPLLAPSENEQQGWKCCREQGASRRKSSALSTFVADGHSSHLQGHVGWGMNTAAFSFKSTVFGSGA